MIALASSLTLFGCAEMVAAPTAPPLTQRQAAIQSHFTETLAEYHRSVVAADLLSEGSDPMAIRRSVRLLSDALIAIPHADAPVALAAQEIRVEEARASIASPDSAMETKAVHEALSAAQSALSDLAAGPYAAAPEAAALAAELGQAIGRIDTGVSLNQERRVVIHALALADRTMTTMHTALTRGVVLP